MDAISYASSSILGFDDNHPATKRARELFRLMSLKFSGITNMKEIQSYWHILALDAACRELQVPFDKASLKRKVSITLDKYMRSLNMVRSVLQLGFKTEVSIESLDSCFGSGGLSSRARGLLADFRSKLDSTPTAATDFQSNINVYNACAFMEAAKLGRTPLENMKSQILDFCEVPVSLFHQKRFFFTQALNLETKRPLAHLTVPGAIGSPLSAASSSHSAASPPSAAADSGGAPGNATALSETLIKPAKGKEYNISSHARLVAQKAGVSIDSLQNMRSEKSTETVSLDTSGRSGDNQSTKSVSIGNLSTSIRSNIYESEDVARMLANKFKSYNAMTASESLDENVPSSLLPGHNRIDARSALPQASSKRAIELAGGAGHVIQVKQAEASSAVEAVETRRRYREEYDRWKEAVITKHRRLNSEVE